MRVVEILVCFFGGAFGGFMCWAMVTTKSRAWESYIENLRLEQKRYEVLLETLKKQTARDWAEVLDRMHNK